MLYKFIICFLAGIGAGLGTGFAGMSAAAVISPMLITFLDIPAYQAVGIALASDVLASAASAYTYGKHKNLDIKNGIVMMITVLCFTMVGSWVSSFLKSGTMGMFSTFMTVLLGVKFIVKPVMTTKESMNEKLSPEQRVIRAILCGMMIGFICGFVGAGGGMMMLLVLVTVLGYELKTAVGTSVFIMSFTALTGSLSHIAIGGMPDVWALVFCILSTLLWAQIAAKLANKASAKTLNRATGCVLIVIGIITIVFNYIK
ncbi:MAG: sulfite exporter TauE/SafE family protein [Acutalibacteraceae bacterium]